ncbi:MAG: hypothetical protein DSM106950_36870 [Stigonema ocellatum SAG 48.90 = DSM 106950]|nr:hypothetical protein [Stigonema ocellatum SAG 48.90 = DSM 106950]
MSGYCGTSGAAAASGNGVWYIPPDPEQREAAMASREAMGGFLCDRQNAARNIGLKFLSRRFVQPALAVEKAGNVGKAKLVKVGCDRVASKVGG